MPTPQFTFSEGILRIEGPLSSMQLSWKPVPSALEWLPAEKTWRPFRPEFRLVRPLNTALAEPARDSLLHLTDSAVPANQELAERKRLAFAAFRAELPPALLPHVERFPSRQWALLTLLHDNAKAIDVAAASPVLAWCLANHDQFRGKLTAAAMLQAVWHSHQKQRDILEWLGFPGTESTVRLMRKILPEAASPSLLNGLKMALKADSPLFKALVHLKSVNAGVLGLISSFRLHPCLTPQLLEEVAQSEAEKEFPQTGPRLMEVLTLLKESALNRVLRPIRSLAEAETLLHETEEEYQAHLRRAEDARIEALLQEEAREEARRLEEAQQAATRHAAAQEAAARRARARARRTVKKAVDPAVRRSVKADILRERRKHVDEQQRQTGLVTFPPPPIPGNDSFIPLTRPHDLADESRLQINCVRTYMDRVLSGDTYIYRIVAPQRATLSIVLAADGSWYRSELKAFKNGRVHGTTETIIDNWLDSYRLSV